MECLVEDTREGGEVTRAMRRGLEMKAILTAAEVMRTVVVVGWISGAMQRKEPGCEEILNDFVAVISVRPENDGALLR